jgi:hypothetical protein
LLIARTACETEREGQQCESDARRHQKDSAAEAAAADVCGGEDRGPEQLDETSPHVRLWVDE